MTTTNSVVFGPRGRRLEVCETAAAGIAQLHLTAERAPGCVGGTRARRRRRSSPQPRCAAPTPLAEGPPRCGRFDGCQTDAQRAAALGAAGTAAPLHCGFLAPSGLDAVRAHYAAAKCRVAVVTVIFGGYDPLPAPPPEPPEAGAVCYAVLVDEMPPRVQGAGEGWDLHVVDPLPYPGELARSAHAVKILAGRLFPSAASVIAHDGKVRLAVDPLVLLSSPPLRRAPIAVVYNPFFDRGVRGEFRREQAGGYDCERLDTQARTYARERADRAKGMLDSVMLLHAQRTNCTERLWCLWHGEVARFSFREQLSFFRALDALRGRPLLTMLSRPLFYSLFEQPKTHHRLSRGRGREGFAARGIKVCRPDVRHQDRRLRHPELGR